MAFVPHTCHTVRATGSFGSLFARVWAGAPHFSDQAAERLGDHLVTISGRVLVDQSSAGARMAEACHQLLEARACGSRQCPARVPEIMKMQIGSTPPGPGLVPDGPEVRPPQRRAP